MSVKQGGLSGASGPKGNQTLGMFFWLSLVACIHGDKMLPRSLSIRSLSGGAVFLGPWEGFKPGDEILVKLDGFGFGKWFVFPSPSRPSDQTDGGLPQSLRLTGRRYSQLC